MRTISLATFARRVTDAADGHKHAVRDGLDDAGRRMAARARSYIGQYQTGQVGPFGPWPPLAPSTVAEKQRLGYAPPDNPLYRTGEMRDSIGHSVTARTVTVGSADPVAAYQEFGTATIPPRPFIGRAVAEMGREEARRVMAQVLWPIRRTSRWR